MLLLYSLAQALGKRSFHFLALPPFPPHFCLAHTHPLMLIPCADPTGLETRESQGQESYLQKGAVGGWVDIDLGGVLRPFTSQELCQKGLGLTLVQGVHPSPALDWLVDSWDQDRLCLGVTGQVFAIFLSLPVSFFFSFFLPPLFLVCIGVERSDPRPQSTQDCCWAVTPASFGRMFHRLRGAGPLWGREESVPWRNGIWVDARDKAWGRRERG